MSSAPKVVGIVGHIGPYDPKSMEWSTYKGRFTFYLQANSITDAALKRATLLTIIGDSAYRMLADLHLPDELSTVAFDTLITDLDSSYGKKVSKLASRVRFQSISQHEGQTVDEYLAELRHASIDCGFGDQLDHRLKDQFVVGLKSDQIKRKLLEDEDKSLADTVKRARDLELVNKESVSSKPSQTSSVSAYHVRQGFNESRFTPRFSQPQQSQSFRSQPQQSLFDQYQPCYRCGTSGHQPDQCDYYIRRYKCFNCQITGHKASVCCQPRQPQRCHKPFQPRGSFQLQQSSQPQRGFQPQRFIEPQRFCQPQHGIEPQRELSQSDQEQPVCAQGTASSPFDSQYMEEYESTASVLTVHADQDVIPAITYIVKVNGTSIKMEVDSGSCYSLLSSDWWNRLGRPLLRYGPTLIRRLSKHFASSRNRQRRGTAQ